MREVIGDRFDAGFGNTPERTRYPLVPDPEGTEINQAYLSYRTAAGRQLRLGRQRINLDEQRFIGGVGWRQNEQTYDAASIVYRHDRLTATYVRVDNVNRVFGERVAAGDHRQDGTHLLHLQAGAGPIGRLSAYHFAIDNADAPAFSTRTTGLRLAGTRRWGGASVGYLAEVATQRDLARNPDRYRAHYRHLKGNISRAAFSLAAGWEVLSGDAAERGGAFRTPLGTLHAFNGWADRFLTTPDAGLDDRYLVLGYRPGRWRAEARLHRFAAEDGGRRLGHELDLQLGRAFGERWQVDLMAAAFDGRSALDDAIKVWAMASVAF